MPASWREWADVEGRLKAAGEALLDRRLRIAVTGLSRSGKTVFITALAHHLERGTGLPFLNAVADRRYRGARVADDTPAGLDPFPYQAYAAALTAEPPNWPDASIDLRLLRLELRFRPRSQLVRLASETTLNLDILDYPGEWLIDLPLLEQTYDAWASTTLTRLEQAPYRARLARFLGAPGDVDADALTRLYIDGLVTCRDDRLSLLQPGRALTPMAFDMAPEALLFAPVPTDHPLAVVFRERFEAYLQRWVEPFKSHVVDAVDRQIVLVDVLESLNRGPAHFDDTQAALGAILEAFNYGRGGYWRRLLAPKVERLVFCATKADHVANTQHANLKLLMQNMVDDAARRVRVEGIPMETLAVASVQATDTVRTNYDGQLLSCVRGILDATREEKIIFPGEVPATMPRGAEWDDQRFNFRRFAPRRLDAPNGRGHGHIRLDQVLEAAIGDRLV